MNPRWTPEEDRTLAVLRLEGLTEPEIAERIPGRTRDGVHWRSAVLMLTGPGGRARAADLART